MALFAPGLCCADQTGLSEAEKHANAGEWDKARQVYQSQLVSAGKPEDLPGSFFYNYGTILANAGAVGEAYVALMRASFFMPLNSDVRHNLWRVEQTVPASVRAVRPALWLSFWPRALRNVQWEVWMIAALAFSALALVGSSLDKMLTWVAITGTLSFLVVGGLAMAQQRLPVYGVMALTKVKSGPASTFTDIVTLEPGSLVNEDGSRDGWRKIRFRKEGAEETVGWVEPAALLGLR